jgi:hypothetical protein
MLAKKASYSLALRVACVSFGKELVAEFQSKGHFQPQVTVSVLSP